MEIANARLRLNKVGSDVPVTGLTPAEALVLHVLHQANNGGSTFGEEFEKIVIAKTPAQTVTGHTEEQVIPAVEVQPAVEGRPGKAAVAYKPTVEAVAYRAAVQGKPAVAAQPAVGVPGEPGYKPAVEAIAAVPFQPEVKEVKAQPEVLAQEAVPAIAAVAAVPAKPAQVIPAKDITRDRTDVEEVRRLTVKYGKNVNKKGDRILKLIWPEMSPKLPQKFSELDWKNLNYDGIEVGAVNYVTGTPTGK